MINLGLVGLGPVWESRYRPVLEKLRHRVRVRAVYDPIASRGEQVAFEFGATPYQGVTALLGSGGRTGHSGARHVVARQRPLALRAEGPQAGLHRGQPGRGLGRDPRAAEPGRVGRAVGDARVQPPLHAGDVPTARVDRHAAGATAAHFDPRGPAGRRCARRRSRTGGGDRFSGGPARLVPLCRAVDGHRAGIGPFAARRSA